MRAAAVVEVAVERVFFRGDLARLVIEPYHGYATPEHLVARGRVLAIREAERDVKGGSRLANARQMFRLFATHEVSGVTLRSGAHSAVTDAEGYFTLFVPRRDRQGWVDVPVSGGGTSAECPVLIARPDAGLMVISDIDDTMMKTGAHNTLTNLWTSFTGSVESRTVYPDAVELMQVLRQDGRNPVYFVSSSPWNFHEFLEDVFARAGLPAGPKFLKDYGFSEDQFLTSSHGNHKGDAIDILMAANPHLPAVLIGDTGQHDAQIYADAVSRHPGRIVHVVLRSAADGVGADDALQIDRMRAANIDVTVGNTYREALALLAAKVQPAE
ncbi:phosphatase domain-containing protein [Salipiger sp. IMCC34102]|uniref:phosphatase domain-containing protein n=1 Tax=Salipiger sp. IMCC34102 TaxID=2510647 RepID=UPI0013E9D6E1|nr:phosphatase domain-containing protein [Salipiger sp. IMCC34102]